MSDSSTMLAEPLWEITGGRMDLAIRLIERATHVAAALGEERLSLRHFEAVVDLSPSIARGSTRNPFRRH